MQQRALSALCRIVELSAKLLTAQLEGPRLAEVQKLSAEKNVENERINRQLLASEGLITAWNTHVGAGGGSPQADPLSKKRCSATSITKFLERSRSGWCKALAPAALLTPCAAAACICRPHKEERGASGCKAATALL
jgi:hypothetical protein